MHVVKRNKRPAGDNLRVLRAKSRISQMEAAAHLGCGHHRYWRIENGYQEPTEWEQKALAKLFGVRVADIFPAEGVGA